MKEFFPFTTVEPGGIIGKVVDDGHNFEIQSRFSYESPDMVSWSLPPDHCS
jgi:hypothetical protein